jgi:hypothetical protein
LGSRDVGESEEPVRASGTVRDLERRLFLGLEGLGLREVSEGIWRGYWRKRGVEEEGRLGMGWERR